MFMIWTKPPWVRWAARESPGYKDKAVVQESRLHKDEQPHGNPILEPWNAPFSSDLTPLGTEVFCGPSRIPGFSRVALVNLHSQLGKSQPRLAMRVNPALMQIPQGVALRGSRTNHPGGI